jgi:hypothetical protein
MSATTVFTTPVGRLVYGSLYKPRDKDAQGNPLTIKSGPNVGKPKVEYGFGIAIPKGPEQHWAQTEWGQKIWGVGHTAFPGGQTTQREDFAWKVMDGDSTKLNKNNKRPCDQEGFKGHWILKFSSSYPPKIYRPNGQGAYEQLVEQDAIKNGYYVQVNGTVGGNNSPQTPGVYLNHSMVCFSGYGAEITSGPDVNQAGFGQAPLPPGASQIPLAANVPLPSAPTIPAIPGAPMMPPAPMLPAAYPSAPVVANPVIAPSVVPNPYPIPGMVAAPAAVPLPPAMAPVTVPAPPLDNEARMTPKARAEGQTYAGMIGGGWNEALMIQHGYLSA